MSILQSITLQSLYLDCLYFVKFPIYHRPSLHTTPFCCFRVLNSSIEVEWRAWQLSLGPYHCWEQVWDFGTAAALNCPKQH